MNGHDEFKRRRDDSSGFLQRNWAIITTIAGVFVFYGMLSANYQNLERRVCNNEVKVENIAQIQKDVEWIKKSVDRIESTLDTRR